MWTLTISPESTRGLIHPDIFSTLLAAIEITRRAIWNLFRLENEHLNNVDNFRALKGYAIGLGFSSVLDLQPLPPPALDIPLPIQIRDMD